MSSFNILAHLTSYALNKMATARIEKLKSSTESALNESERETFISTLNTFTSNLDLGTLASALKSQLTTDSQKAITAIVASMLPDAAGAALLNSTGHGSGGEAATENAAASAPVGETPDERRARLKAKMEARKKAKEEAATAAGDAASSAASTAAPTASEELSEEEKQAKIEKRKQEEREKIQAKKAALKEKKRKAAEEKARKAAEEGN